MLVEINNRTRSRLDLKLMTLVAEKFLLKHQIKKNLSIAIIGDQRMRALNFAYRKINKFTDILSFAGDDDLGELVIDYQQIKRQSKKFGQSAKRELIFILVHGLLHLIGYNDDTEAKRLKMIELGQKFINSLKI